MVYKVPKDDQETGICLEDPFLFLEKPDAHDSLFPLGNREMGHDGTGYSHICMDRGMQMG